MLLRTAGSPQGKFQNLDMKETNAAMVRRGKPWYSSHCFHRLCYKAWKPSGLYRCAKFCGFSLQQHSSDWMSALDTCSAQRLSTRCIQFPKMKMEFNFKTLPTQFSVTSSPSRKLCLMRTSGVEIFVQSLMFMEYSMEKMLGILSCSLTGRMPRAYPGRLLSHPR